MSQNICKSNKKQDSFSNWLEKTTHEFQHYSLVIPTPELPPLRRELENEVPVQKSIIHSIKRSYDLDGRKCLNISESAKTHGLPLKKERKAIKQPAHLLLSR